MKRPPHDREFSMDLCFAAQALLYAAGAIQSASFDLALGGDADRLRVHLAEARKWLASAERDITEFEITLPEQKKEAAE